MKRRSSVTVFGVLNLTLALWLLGESVVFGAVVLDYRADQILIQPKAGMSPAVLTAFHTAHGTKVAQTFPAAGGSQVITLPAGETVSGLVAKYQQSGLVEFAEPDYLVHANATLPNDPKFLDGTLWGLNNYGQNGGTTNADIDAPEAWDVLTSASNIVVAVLDTGIRATHEDLASNMWVNPFNHGYGWDAFTGLNNPIDDGGHGTLVAGILGAVGNNGKGVTGVAWRVQMMACKCLNSSGNGNDSTVIACINYAVGNGAKIINASFDTPTPSLAFSNAIVAARDAGVIWVASAGNNAYNVEVTPSYPTCYGIDNIVAVAATTRTDDLSSYSNYGATHVALAAPGDQIYTTWSPNDSYYTSLFSGTSLSAPYVSGALALLLAEYPSENYQQIIRRLLQATDPLPSLAGKCVTGGRLNLKKALNPDIQLTPVAASPGTFQLHLSARANRQCVLQISTDLIGWTAIYTNLTSTNGTFDFTNTIGSPRQFFRAVAAP